MANEGDLAQRIIEQEEEIRQRQREAAAKIPKSVSEFCIDCDGEIPEARQIATGGTDRCVWCQEIHDRKMAVR